MKAEVKRIFDMEIDWFITLMRFCDVFGNDPYQKVLYKTELKEPEEEI
jgi:hypothetical protein